jgi:hypothetical protein
MMPHMPNFCAMVVDRGSITVLAQKSRIEEGPDGQ